MYASEWNILGWIYEQNIFRVISQEAHLQVLMNEDCMGLYFVGHNYGLSFITDNFIVYENLMLSAILISS